MFGHNGPVNAPDEVAREHQTDAANAETSRGLFDGFEAYRTPTETDYRALLTRGLIVPDTNVFLNLYRYNEQTRNDVLSVLNALGDQLWVPRQVIVEFWRNREKVLQDPRDTEKTIRELAEQRDRTIETLRAWANRVGLSNERKIHFSEILSHAFDSVAEDVKSLADDDAASFAHNTSRDPVVTALEPILKGRVGAPLEKIEYENALGEAKRRAEAKQPPGYKDIAKTGEAAAGDYLIWSQILREVRGRPRDVLIVTGDAKDDWWRRERGELACSPPPVTCSRRTSRRRRRMRAQLLLLSASAAGMTLAPAAVAQTAPGQGQAAPNGQVADPRAALLKRLPAGSKLEDLRPSPIAGMYAFAPLMGWLTDRLGRRPVIFAGVVLLLGACALAGTAGHNAPMSAVARAWLPSLSRISQSGCSFTKRES